MYIALFYKDIGLFYTHHIGLLCKDIEKGFSHATRPRARAQERGPKWKELRTNWALPPGRAGPQMRGRQNSEKVPCRVSKWCIY